MKNLKALKQQTTDMEAKLKEMKAEIERMENGWEMKCLYKDGDEYYFVSANGLAKYDSWDNYDFEKRAFAQGNIFKTQQEAELELKRRNLLTRFRAFRDECNEGWKPDWKDDDDRKHYIFFSPNAGLQHYSTGICRDFQLFGFFRNKEDVKLAIKLFGDEIKKLFVECE